MDIGQRESSTAPEGMPEDQKNTDYWHKRRKNNEAARRSREKRKVNDVLLERRVMVLTEENKQLKSQLLAIKRKYGEFSDLCTPLSNRSTIGLAREFYDGSKFDTDSSDGPSDLQYVMSHSKDMVDSSAISRLFTSKIFTNASGDTSATVHVNTLPGSTQIQSNKFVLPNFSTMSENSIARQGLDLARDLSKARIGGLPNFDFSREWRTDAAQEKLLMSGKSGSRTDPMSDDAETVDTYVLRPDFFRQTYRTEEEVALLLAGKFNTDILRTLNINQQVPLTNFTQLTEETVEKLGYSTYAQSLHSNGSTTPLHSLPVDVFFKSLRDKARDSAASTSKRQSSLTANTHSQECNGSSELTISPGISIRETKTTARDLTSREKRKSADSLPERSPPKIAREEESVEETTSQPSHSHSNEARKKSPAQLPQDSNRSSELTMSLDISIREMETPEATARDLTSCEKRKSADSLSERSPPKIAREGESVEKATSPPSGSHSSEARKKSPVQLPHKLRLKKAGMCGTT